MSVCGVETEVVEVEAGGVGVQDLHGVCVCVSACACVWANKCVSCTCECVCVCVCVCVCFVLHPVLGGS